MTKNIGFHLPLVSIIIPSYNHAQYIDNAINSVLSQTYPYIELIVVDDGSSDNSHEVLQAYAGDPRVILILNKENRGQSAVINQALEIAKGEFVSFLPSDDWYLPDKTKLQVEKFQSSPSNVGVVYGRGQRFFEDTGETKDVILPVYTGKVAEKFIEWGPFVYPVTPMFRKECFDKVRPDEKYKAEGEAIYIRMAMHYDFEYVDEVLAVMRDHTYNIGKNPYVMYDEVILYWTKLFQSRDLPQNLLALRSVAMERAHRVYGFRFLGEFKDFAKARECFRCAIEEKPGLLLKPKFLAGFIISGLPPILASKLVDWFARPGSRNYR